jgi:hypothetical protein
MSTPKKSDSPKGQGVLSNLPRTRPQRSSPRRAAARKATAAASAARTAPARANGRAATERERVPRQGFECEGERANEPVQPPGGAELVAGAAEIIGELAKAGFSTGERLLKDVLSRLPLS